MSICHETGITIVSLDWTDLFEEDVDSEGDGPEVLSELRHGLLGWRLLVLRVAVLEGRSGAGTWGHETCKYGVQTPGMGSQSVK